jgi:hypothetical protein
MEKGSDGNFYVFIVARQERCFGAIILATDPDLSMNPSYMQSWSSARNWRNGIKDRKRDLQLFKLALINS